MQRQSTQGLLIITALVLALGAGIATATSIQDLVRIKGHEENVLVGMGIVVGLNGTGDKSKDSYVAARPYAKLLTNLGNSVEQLDELAKADAFAIVQVTMKVPPTGARVGDTHDVFVDTLFNAESLEGGRLVVSLLRVPGPDSPDAKIMARAEGPLVLGEEDPTSGVVRRGGMMLRDIRTNVVTRSGRMWLVLKDQYAGYPIATTLANIINEELGDDEEIALYGYSRIAHVEDAKNIRVELPDADRKRPAEFIAALMTRPVDPSFIHTQTPARIVINEKEGIISITGNVEVGPVGITHRGMQLTSIAPQQGAQAPSGGGFVGLDTTDGSSRNSTALIDLLRAFDQLKVPVEDQIAIIYELQKTGSLHAEIVHE
jgi:flagellar P-ring protein precursor FlgI